MKKFWIIVCVIAVVIFLGYIGKDMDFSGIKNNNTNNTANTSVITGKNGTSNSKNSTSTTKNTTNNSTNTTENKTENKTENTVNQTNATNQTNTTEQGNTQNQTNTATQQNSNTVEVVSVSDEDNALALAKKTYGSTDGVYFKIEQTEGNGVYIVSVRDLETTSAIVWYTVNVKNQTVK